MERDRFRAQSNAVTLPNPPVLDQDKDDEDAQPLVTRKRRRAITDTERKALRDYYFDPANGKPAQKVIRTWFLKLQLRTAGSSHAF